MLGTQFMAFLERHTIITRLQLLPVGSTECTGTPESLSRYHIQFKLRPILRLLSKRTQIACPIVQEHWEEASEQPSHLAKCAQLEPHEGH